MEKTKQTPEEKINMRREISRLVKLLGVTQISGRRVGHYDLTNLDKIPEREVPMVYGDLVEIYDRRRRVA